MAEPLCSQTIVQHCYIGEVEKLNSMYINIIIVSWNVLFNNDMCNFSYIRMQYSYKETKITKSVHGSNKLYQPDESGNGRTISTRFNSQGAISTQLVKERTSRFNPISQGAISNRFIVKERTSRINPD